MDDSGYRQLKTWQKAMDAVDSIYRLTAGFPDVEKFGLISQMRRAAVSVPSNIAEGYGRKHRKEYLQHLNIARGSLMELETQLIVSVRQEFCDRQTATEVWSILQDIGKLLNGLIRSLAFR